MKHFVFALSVCAALAAVAGCTSRSSSSSNGPSTSATAALANPSDFPLASDSRVIDVKPFSQTVAKGSDQGSAFARSGAGTYSGQEVLAETSHSDADLREWLAGLKKNPPTGYVSAAHESADVDQELAKYGVAFGAFEKTGSPTPHGVLVVVMDPKQVSDKLGLAVGLVERYRDLPASFRQSVDEQMKQKVGFSATEATDPTAPIGITLSALRELSSSQNRAIVLVDATKD